MKVILHKKFKKKFKKFSNEIHIQFKNRLNIFIKDPHDTTLNNHALHGKYLGFRSINVSGDLRAVYRMEADNIVLFVDIDNHANLYK